MMQIRTRKSIRVVGAISSARWMARALLIGKTYLFRDQIDLTPEISYALRRICIFISHLYVKFWNRATYTVDAPANDLLLIQQLYLYKTYDNEIAEAAINGFREHLWYLGEELVVFSLFSNKVSVATKNRMRPRITMNITSRSEESLRFISEPTTQFNNIDLEYFVQPRSNFLFQLCEISSDFLQQDASLWEHIESYKEMKNLIENTITVVNDGAERVFGLVDRSIKGQKARKEDFFKNLILSKFDNNKRA